MLCISPRPFRPHLQGSITHCQKEELAKDSELASTLKNYVDPFWLVREGTQGKKLVENEGLEVQKQNDACQ